MSRYTNMCQIYCHITNKRVQTYLTLAYFYDSCGSYAMQPMFSELCEWTMHIIMHIIVVIYYLIAHLIMFTVLCMLTLQPIFFTIKKQSR